MIIAERIHLFPSRTQKLSSPALKILGGKLPGKLGSRRFFLFFGKYMNDEGTAPSLAAGAVPFLMWEEKGKRPRRFPPHPIRDAESSLSAGEYSGS